MINLVIVDSASDLRKPITTSVQSSLDSKANLANPTCTGTVRAISRGMFKLAKVDKTSNWNKTISNSTQTALNNKVPWVYDSFFPLGASCADLPRPQKVRQPQTKLHSDLAVVGTCNTSYELTVDGINILDELALTAPTDNTTCAGAVNGITKSIITVGHGDNAREM